MQQLWAPWRISYIKGQKEKGCIFCLKQKSTDDRHSLILSRGDHSFVLMNLYPYNNSHLLISPYKHVESTDQLNMETLNEIIWFANESMIIIKKNLSADGYNFGANIGSAGGAGIADHIHFHVVPRWNGDTNFMPVVGETKVQVQGLQETYDELILDFDKIIKN
ncbi:HIT domain-containing protein [Candidatus Marinimicrobia bacterium]|nr:HIT domain-containing protein [Candidatus Neomarinimicrobiota bacterium]RZP30398.1 MAG: HIT domain-containing protein [bacterium]|tara:strand:- start:8083 stop:8574 length:492 start_codon:yes stop_codon:yes gene_type:complete